MNKGKVYLVGAGPGDPSLITLKGVNCIKNADVVVYDRLINQDILSYAREDAELICFGKKPKSHSIKQDEINRLIIKKASEGKTIVRLKGGDPFIFGRGGEEALALAEKRIPFEIVPGVSSAIAVPTYAGIPLTHRDYASAVTFITGHKKDGSSLPVITKEIASLQGTLVILMGAGNLGSILDDFIRLGKSPSAQIAIISSGTTPRQEILTGTIKELKNKTNTKRVKPPAVIVIGDVVNLSKKLRWYEKKPLFNKKFLITSPEPGASKIASHLENFGAEAIKLPVIKIVPVENFLIIDKAIKEINKYHWIIFTSQNGIDLFMKRFILKGKHLKDFKAIKFAVIGKVTGGKLKKYGIKASFIPKKYNSEALLSGLKKYSLKGKNILIPRAQETSKVLPLGLKKIGAKVDEIVLYRIQNEKVNCNKVKSLLKENNADVVAFTSPSGVKSFFNLFTKKEIIYYFNKISIASIGPVTSKAIEEFEMKADIMPKEYTIKGMVEAIDNYFNNIN